MAELVAIGYPDPDTAGVALEEIERMSREFVIRADQVAAITRDGAGDTTTLTNANISPNAPAWTMFWSMLFALLYYAPVLGLPLGRNMADMIDVVEHSGIDPEFQVRAREMLVPDSSALFLIIEHVSVQIVVDALEEFGGTVLQSPMSKQTQDTLQEMLHSPGAVPSRPTNNERRTVTR